MSRRRKYATPEEAKIAARKQRDAAWKKWEERNPNYKQNNIDYSNDWQKRNRDHMREYHRKWREANPERWRELCQRAKENQKLKKEKKDGL